MLGSSIVNTVLQLGEPFGQLLQKGGTPYALAGFFLTVPVIAAARFLAYTDLRTRKEGWDIQLRFMAIAAEAEETGRAGRRGRLLARGEAGRQSGWMQISWVGPCGTGRTSATSHVSPSTLIVDSTCWPRSKVKT